MHHKKRWNWQQKEWPHFRFDPKAVVPFENDFLLEAGKLSGSLKHVSDADSMDLLIEILGDEAFHSAAIEGEVLRRESVQSSLRKHFGLSVSKAARVTLAEQAMADMRLDLYKNFAKPLTQSQLFHWHRYLMHGIQERDNMPRIGAYRKDEAPMQVVSGPSYAPKVHFEAPPASRVPAEMKSFIDWFNNTAPGAPDALPLLTRAALVHLYFISIHPFDDGNGRIARALCEKVISQHLKTPALLALSHVIYANRKQYYLALEQNNQSLTVDSWLNYFSIMSLKTLEYSQKLISFVILKAQFFEKYRGQFNERQEKALARLWRTGPDGFVGGFSADKYRSITGASRATATRDLQNLVELGVFLKTGQLKGTRYALACLS